MFKFTQQFLLPFSSHFVLFKSYPYVQEYARKPSLSTLRQKRFQPAGKSASLSKAGRPGVCWESDTNNETSLSRLQSSRGQRNARPATLLTRTCSQAIDFKGQHQFHRSPVEIDRWHSPELLRYLAKVRQF